MKEEELNQLIYKMAFPIFNDFSEAIAILKATLTAIMATGVVDKELITQQMEKADRVMKGNKDPN